MWSIYKNYEWDSLRSLFHTTACFCLNYPCRRCSRIRCGHLLRQPRTSPWSLRFLWCKKEGSRSIPLRGVVRTGHRSGNVFSKRLEHMTPWNSDHCPCCDCTYGPHLVLLSTDSPVNVPVAFSESREREVITSEWIYPQRRARLEEMVNCPWVKRGSRGHPAHLPSDTGVIQGSDLGLLTL